MGVSEKRLIPSVVDAIVAKVNQKRITNSKDLRKPRAILPDPVARARRPPWSDLDSWKEATDGLSVELVAAVEAMKRVAEGRSRDPEEKSTTPKVRELSPAPANQGHKEIDELDEWRHRAAETARVFVQNRRRGILSVPISRNALPARAPPRERLLAQLW